jgi:hypothetical protein
MKTLKIILLFAVWALFPVFSSAQSNVTYAYDAAGNRISRTIVIPAQLRAAEEEEKEEEEPTVYSEALSELLIKIYPNPTSGLIQIEIENLPANETADIALYHLSGKLITSRQTAGSTEIDITGQPAGIYLMRIVAGKEQTEWKIIKK